MTDTGYYIKHSSVMQHKYRSWHMSMLEWGGFLCVCINLLITAHVTMVKWRESQRVSNDVKHIMYIIWELASKGAAVNI